MPSKTKKSPNDYPLFSIRLSTVQKEELNQIVEETRTALNKKLSKDEKLWMKNEVIFKALMIGLPELKRKHLRNNK